MAFITTLDDRQITTLDGRPITTLDHIEDALKSLGEITDIHATVVTPRLDAYLLTPVLTARNVTPLITTRELKRG